MSSKPRIARRLPVGLARHPDQALKRERADHQRPLPRRRGGIVRVVVQHRAVQRIQRLVRVVLLRQCHARTVTEALAGGKILEVEADALPIPILADAMIGAEHGTSVVRASLTPHTRSMTDTMILDAIDAFLERDVKPHVHRLEHDDIYPEAIVARMRELGLFGATIAPEYGGLGLPCATYADIVERIARVWMSLTGIFNSHLIMSAIVQRNGTEAQKRAFLPRFASGELRGGLALTEPDCGTDLQAIRVTARRDGDGYVVNGTKTWISNGIQGSCFALLVKTDTTAEPRHRGMSMLLAEKGPGFTVSRKLEKLGYKGIDSAELVFQDYRVPADRLIGGVEGRGLQHALSGLELGRINVAARGVGIAQAALDELAALCTSSEDLRRADRAAPGDPDKARRHGDAHRGIAPAGASCRRMYDRGDRCDMEAGMAKLFATETALENATEAMRVHGGYGYSTEFPVERLYRDAPLLVIGEGTNELQRIIIARQLVARNPV